MKYNNFQEVIDILNGNNIPYLILRNYDNLLDDSMYMDGHGDVDMLVENSVETCKIIQACSYPKRIGDITHFFIYVNNKKVKLDMRYVGDGYYCEKWEKEMLARRIKEKSFYVMNKEDYFYSLIYHAILQKRVFSSEYAQRLAVMAKALNIEISSKDCLGQYIAELEKYMKKNSYKYTYTVDKHVPLLTKYVSHALIEKNHRLFWLHWKYETHLSMLEFAVKCKHLITKGKFA